MFTRVITRIAAAILPWLLVVPAKALILPPDPFDATDRYALLFPDADGAVTEIQVKLQVPEVEAPETGQLIAKLAYKLPPSTASGSPFFLSVSRAISVEDLAPAESQIVTFDFSDYPVPRGASWRSLAVLYLRSDADEPQVIAEYPSERLLLRPSGAVIETELTSSQTASSGSVVIDPVTILRESGPPQTETIRFPVTDTNGVFFLHLANGDNQGYRRVTAAVVTLNGQAIFRPEEFNRRVVGLDRQITVKPGENVLELTARGRPGTQLALEIVRQDAPVCRALGPHTFIRATGKPVTEEVTFPLAAQLSGPFTLHFSNGDGSGGHRVDSGVITLNGQPVFSASDFNEQIGELSRAVTLQALNTLRVELAGAPGDRLTLEITGFDTVPPQVTITSPAPGAVVTAGPITVTGMVDDPSATVTVNGIVATVAPDGTFTAEGVPLEEGDNVITVIATDSCGNQGQDSVTVRLDTGPAEPPELLLCAAPYIESPLDPYEITDCPPEVWVSTRGSVFGETDPSADSLRLEGVLLPDGLRVNDPDPIDWALREGTFFSASLWILAPDGPHTVTAAVANARGERTATVTFLKDTVPPVLTVTSPTNPLFTNGSTVTITGTLDDPEARLWLIQPGMVRIPVTDGTFSLTVTLPTQQGTYTYWLAAWDHVDNAASVKLSITRDTILPTVNIFDPVPGAYLPTRTVTVSGVMIDQNPSAATLSVNSGAPIPITVPPNVHGGVPFSVAAEFNEGFNTFSVTAVDKAGNTRTVNSFATVDTVPPTLSLTAPTNGAELSGVVAVRGFATDVGSGLFAVSLLIDGQVRVPDLGAVFTFNLDTLTVPAGARTLTVRAKDRAGNTVETTISVTIRQQMRLQITSHGNGQTVLYSPTLVWGTIADNFSPGEIGITVNGYVAEVQGGKFAVDGVALQPGANPITTMATDGAGVTATATVNVTVPAGVDEPPVQLEATSANRTAPANVVFDAEIKTALPIVSYQMDFEGDGVIDLSGTTWSAPTKTYSAAGLYLPTLVARDAQGTTYIARTVVSVWDAAALDALVRGKWDAMRDAISAGNVDGALAMFLPASRDRYQLVFLDLGSSLPTILGSVEQVHLLAVTSYGADAEAIRTENGTAFSYPITYRRDLDGIWKFDGF